MERGILEGEKRAVCGAEKQRFQAEKGASCGGERKAVRAVFGTWAGSGTLRNAGHWRRKRGSPAEEMQKKFTEMASMSFQVSTFAA